MRYQRHNTLIADAGYDSGWTRLDGRKFNPVPTTPQGIAEAQQEADNSNEFPWLSRGSSIILNSSTPTGSPILLADNYRNFLLIQNNSVAPSPPTDVAPDLYVSLSGPIVAFTSGSPPVTVASQYSWKLKPDIALVLDERVMNNSIYIGFFGGAGGGLANGVLTYGRTQNSPPSNQPSPFIQAGGGDAGFDASGRFYGGMVGSGLRR